MGTVWSAEADHQDDARAKRPDRLYSGQHHQDTQKQRLRGHIQQEGQEAVDKNFDMGQGRAEATQDQVNRKDMLLASRQTGTKVVLNCEMRKKTYVHQP